MRQERALESLLFCGNRAEEIYKYDLDTDLVLAIPVPAEFETYLTGSFTLIWKSKSSVNFFSEYFKEKTGYTPGINQAK